MVPIRIFENKKNRQQEFQEQTKPFFASLWKILLVK